MKIIHVIYSKCHTYLDFCFGLYLTIRMWKRVINVMYLYTKYVSINDALFILFMSNGVHN